jgi:hypothetical protein
MPSQKERERNHIYADAFRSPLLTSVGPEKGSSAVPNDHIDASRQRRGVELARGPWTDRRWRQVVSLNERSSPIQLKRDRPAGHR